MTRAMMTNITRRAALRGLAFVSAGAAGVASAEHDGLLTGLVDAYDQAKAAFIAARGTVARLEATHTELIEHWPDVKFDGRRFQYPKAISYHLDRVLADYATYRGTINQRKFWRTRAAGAIRELRAKTTAHDAALGNAGLVEAWDRARDAGTALDAAFAAVVDFRPRDLAEGQQRNVFLARETPIACGSVYIAKDAAGELPALVAIPTKLFQSIMLGQSSHGSVSAS